MADSLTPGEEAERLAKLFNIRGIGRCVRVEQDPDGHERQIFQPDEDEWPSKVTLFDDGGRPIRG